MKAIVVQAVKISGGYTNDLHRTGVPGYSWGYNLYFTGIHRTNFVPQQKSQFKIEIDGILRGVLIEQVNSITEKTPQGTFMMPQIVLERQKIEALNAWRNWVVFMKAHQLRDISLFWTSLHSSAKDLKHTKLPLSQLPVEMANEGFISFDENAH